MPREGWTPSRTSTGRGTALIADHEIRNEETRASFIIPPFPETDFVLEYHLVGARAIVDLSGVTDPKEFDAQVRTVV